MCCDSRCVEVSVGIESDIRLGVDVVNLRENGQAEARTIGTVGFGVTASGDNSIGWRNATSSQGCTGFFQEVIVYHSDQTINTAGIETNINTYFSIY